MELIAIEHEEPGFIRLKWRKSDGGLHMQGIPADESMDMHLDAVNNDMARRGLTQIPSEQRQHIKAEGAKLRTPERIAAARALRERT